MFVALRPGPRPTTPVRSPAGRTSRTVTTHQVERVKKLRHRGHPASPGGVNSLGSDRRAAVGRSNHHAAARVVVRPCRGRALNPPRRRSTGRAPLGQHMGACVRDGPCSIAAIAPRRHGLGALAGCFWHGMHMDRAGTGPSTRARRALPRWLAPAARCRAHPPRCRSAGAWRRPRRAGTPDEQNERLYDERTGLVGAPGGTSPWQTRSPHARSTAGITGAHAGREPRVEQPRDGGQAGLASPSDAESL
jgi:hypothetical protein